MYYIYMYIRMAIYIQTDVYLYIFRCRHKYMLCIHAIDKYSNVFSVKVKGITYVSISKQNSRTDINK